MTNRISKRDWEALSAYIDDQLTRRERVRLESRIQSEPEMAAALEELGRTQAVLRSLPKLRAPRNYTLSPRMVPVRREPSRAFPVLSFASALAAFLLVLVFIGDFFTSQPATMAPPMEPQVAQAPAQAPGVGGGGGGPGIAGTQNKTMEVAPAPTGTATPTGPAALSAEEAGPQESPQAARQMFAGTPTGGERVEAPAAAPAGEAGAEDQLLPTPQTEIVPEGTPGRDLMFRILEIGLAAIAVTTGMAAFLIRRGAGG